MEANEIKEVREEKLKALVEAGVDPYGGKYEPTHTVQGVLTDFQPDQKLR